MVYCSFVFRERRCYAKRYDEKTGDSTRRVLLTMYSRIKPAMRSNPTMLAMTIPSTPNGPIDADDALFSDEAALAISVVELVIEGEGETSVLTGGGVIVDDVEDVDDVAGVTNV